MGALVLDFDSTLTPHESLELYLSRRAGADESPELVRAIEDLTRLGMEGRISFRESLERRLRLVEPELDGLTALGEELAAAPTPGLVAVVQAVAARGHQVWIVSGGFVEVLRPMGAALGIPEERVLGVRALWSTSGAFDGLDPDDDFSTSKVAGLRATPSRFTRPAVGVGDGATDLALRGAGFVDVFVAYVEHADRAPVRAGADHVAGDAAELDGLLETLLP